jgi:hypothetical protein
MEDSLIAHFFQRAASTSTIDEVPLPFLSQKARISCFQA